MSYTYPYPRMLVTVDVVVLLRAQPHGPDRVLLIRRGNDPFRGMYALPGGFPGMDERLMEAAARELGEETGLEGLTLNPLGVFDGIGRDPRGRNIAIAFWAVAPGHPPLRPGDDAADAQWFPLDALPPLAFDHGQVIAEAVRKLK